MASRSRPGAVVDCGQPVDEIFDRLRQAFVGRIGVRPQGVAAGLGDHDGVENGAERGRLDEGHVGVPLVRGFALAAVDLGPLVHPVQIAGLGVVDLEDLAVFADARDHRVGVGDLAEVERELLVLGGGEVLAGQEDHLVVQKGLPDGRHRRRVERLMEIDIAYLGADGARQPGDVEGDGSCEGSCHGIDRFVRGWE